MAKKNRPKRFYDYSLLFCIIFLTVFGLVMIYSASSYTAQLKYNNAGFFMMRQLKVAAGGLALALLISKLDYHWYAKFSMFAYLLSYVLMVAVTLFGREVNGKKRWLGVGSLSFQPTEFVKIALIVFFCGSHHPYGIQRQYLEKYGEGDGTCTPDRRNCCSEQLKFRYHYHGNRLCDAVCGMQKAVAFLCLRCYGTSGGSYGWSACNLSGKDQAAEAISVEPYPCMAVPGSIPYGWRISGAAGTLRHWFRRIVRQGTWREYPEDGICAGGTE